MDSRIENHPASDGQSEDAEPSSELLVTVPENVVNVRADKVLARHFTEWSREKLQIAFERHEILRDGHPILKKTRVSAGQILSVTLPSLEKSDLEPRDIPLEVLLEDDDIVAINKPAGIVAHPGDGVSGDTLVHALLHHTRCNLALAGGKNRPGIVHRLDRDTTGVMIFAKTDNAYYTLNRMFANREINKVYVALVRGVPQFESGTIEKAIGRHSIHRIKMTVRDDGRYAHTDWQIERRWRDWSLIRCRIHTGRTHQIRVHLADLGFPVAGDRLYGFKPRSDDPFHSNRVLLHSIHTWFEHPITSDPVDLIAPLSPHFADAIRCLDASEPTPAIRSRIT